MNWESSESGLTLYGLASLLELKKDRFWRNRAPLKALDTVIELVEIWLSSLSRYGYRACRDMVIELVEILFVFLKKARTKAIGLGPANINTEKPYFFPLWQKKQSEDCIQESTSQ